MADIQLKYLQDLEAASVASSDDLIHISQGGVDFSITVDTIQKSIVGKMFPVGAVYFRADKISPNALFPGTTWVKLPGNRSIRTASDDASDLMSVGGSDSVRILPTHMPAHSHRVSGNTAGAGSHSHTITIESAGQHGHVASTDIQGDHAHSGRTSADGNHTHGIALTNNTNGTGRADGGTTSTLDGYQESEPGGLHDHGFNTSIAGQHSHNVGIEVNGLHSHSAAASQVSAHAHSIDIESDIQGGGEPVSVVNQYVKLIGWMRTK